MSREYDYQNTHYYRRIRDIEKTLNKSRYKKRSTFLNIMSSFLFTMIMVGTISLAVFYFSNSIRTDRYVDMNIQKELKTAINNNAGLDVIKNIYNNRDYRDVTLKDYFNKEKVKGSYNVDTPLSEILYDLKSQYFIKGANDTNYVKRLNKIIDSHNMINPFDKLEQNQKNDFENLRIKMGDNYKIASSDINRITDELYNKNQLVTKYLDKSNTSFWISIVAVVITICLSFYQIFQNRKERTVSLLKEIIKEIEKDSEEKTAEK